MFPGKLADTLDGVGRAQGGVHEFEVVDAGILKVRENLRQDGRDIVLGLSGGIHPWMRADGYFAGFDFCGRGRKWKHACGGSKRGGGGVQELASRDGGGG